LLNFDHPQIPFGLVIVNWDGEVVHKRERLAFMSRRSIEEILRLVLFGAPTLATRGRLLVLWQSQALGDQLIIVFLESPFLCPGERAGALLNATIRAALRRRLLEPIDNIPPAEFELMYYRQQDESAVAA
jgi:hypothetical protein